MFKFNISWNGANKAPIQVKREPDIFRARGSNAFNIGQNLGPGLNGTAANDINVLYPGINAHGGLTQAARTRFDLYQLRNASRLIMREHSLGARIMDMLQENVLSRTPSRPRFKKGIDKMKATAIADAWATWLMRDDIFLDSRESAVEKERQLLGSIITDGDVLINTQIIAGELKLLTYNSDEFYEFGARSGMGKAQQQGVVVNKYGRPESYVMHENTLTNEASFITARMGTALEIPADQCLHVHDIRQNKEWRGIPWITPIITRIAAIKEFDRYTGASMAAIAKVSAVLTQDSDAASNYDGGVSTGGDAYIEGDDSPRLDSDVDSRAANPSNKRIDLDPNTVLQLGPGQKLEWPSPNTPTDMTRTYRKELMYEVAAGMGLDYATLMGNYSETNFAGARQGVLNTRQKYKDLQLWWSYKYRIPLFKMWAMIYEGRLFPGLTMEEREIVKAPSFIGPRWEWVDPLKDISAEIIALGKGLTTPQEIARNRGIDFEQCIEELKEAQDLIQSMDLSIDLFAPSGKKDEGPPAKEDDDQKDQKGGADAGNSK